jgi:hypothetical protein
MYRSHQELLYHLEGELVPVCVLFVSQQMYLADICYNYFKFVKNFPQNLNTVGHHES